MPLLTMTLSAILAAQDRPSPFDLNRVTASAAAPEFSLPAASGKQVKLSDYRGKNVVLVFYRGYW